MNYLIEYYPFRECDVTETDIHLNEIYAERVMDPTDLQRYLSRTNVIVKLALSKAMA